MAGAGLALGHPTLTGQLIREGKLIKPFKFEAPMQEAYYLICAPHLADVPGALDFVAWLRTEIAQDHNMI